MVRYEEYHAPKHQARLKDPSFQERNRLYRLKESRSNVPRHLYRSCKSTAYVKNKEFNLETSDIVLPDVCPVFKTPFVYGDYQRAASVDRIDNSKGYVKGNIQIISRLANNMKHQASPEQLKDFAAWINQSIH